MDGWRDGWNGAMKEGRKDELLGGWVGKWMDELVNGWMNKWKDRQVSRRVNRQTDGLINSFKGALKFIFCTFWGDR